MTFALPYIAAILLTNAPTYKLALAWDAVTNAVSYRVEWVSGPTNLSLTVGTNYATVTNLLKQRYAFTVRAIESHGVESERSAPAPWTIATITHVEADTLAGPWRSETTNQLVDFPLVGGRFYRTAISNWDAGSLMVKQ